MILRCVFTVAALVVFSCVSRADETLDKLMASHEQAIRTGRVPALRKLLSELQRLETQYLKEGRAEAVAEVRTEAARVRDWIAEASQPVAGGPGPQPADFKILYGVGDAYVFGSWENGTLKMENRGFSWVNNGPMAAVTCTRVLKDAFESQITYSGTVYVFSAMEADYQKYVQMYFPTPADAGKHTIKVKRNAAGVMTAELDGKPVNLLSNNGGRPDMFVRFCLHVGKGAKLHLHEMTIKDLSVKK